MHIEAIVQGFTKMKGDIAAERRAYERVWNEREKNLDLVMRITTQVFGSIKGIAGCAIGLVQSLYIRNRVYRSPHLSKSTEIHNGRW